MTFLTHLPLTWGLPILGTQSSSQQPRSCLALLVEMELPCCFFLLPLEKEKLVILPLPQQCYWKAVVVVI